ncbi:hypothetical protein, partial [Listeria monocytogenes]|uniref:hypothetical protein n=1 Tax=Listeria monocytogenes TaxID=1639 RepID=UPI002FDBD32C
HVREYLRLARELGMDPNDPSVHVHDDILMSFAGTRHPWTHNVGKILSCVSSHRKGVGIYLTRPDFQSEREKLIRALQKLKKFSSNAVSPIA